ncbi:MAG: hypothetical protein IKS30_05890 [Treponema sp.]|nr:hypothetical protein [Treponema sp.]
MKIKNIFAAIFILIIFMNSARLGASDFTREQINLYKKTLFEAENNPAPVLKAGLTKSGAVSGADSSGPEQERIDKALTGLIQFYTAEKSFENAENYAQIQINYYIEWGRNASQIQEVELNYIQLLEKLAVRDKKTDDAVIRKLYGYAYDARREVSEKANGVLLKALLRTKNYEEAKILVQQNWPSPQKEEFVQAIARAQNYRGKNPKLALGLSFVPGMGQFYAHQWKDGLNALVLNGALWTVSAWSVWHLNFFDFFILEMDADYRFFRGNLYNAQKDVYIYNDAQTEEILSVIYDSL